MRYYLVVFILLCSFSSQCSALAFPGAEGFGANSLGGNGGTVIQVTSLDDNPDNPKKGTLRWAVEQKGPRIIQFAVPGIIKLKGRLVVKEPYLTIDGSTAPGKGICIRNYSLEFVDTHDIIVRYIRLRRGDVETLKENAKKGLNRPKDSTGLDCISITRSNNVIIDHCSLSWCCDEIINVVKSENITVQWCFLTEPISNSHVHPYGDDHAFGFNASASTLTIHHCLFAHYVMRGPQFEVADVDQSERNFDIKMESINNVVFDYERSGGRCVLGNNTDNEKAGTLTYSFQFINNHYLNGNDNEPDIQWDKSYGTVNNVKIFTQGNIGPIRTNNSMNELEGVILNNGKNVLKAGNTIQGMISYQRLFNTDIPVTTESAEDALISVLNNAGCNNVRDCVDERIIKHVQKGKYGKIIHSQDDVGGWPDYD